ncbi:MAG: DUF5367 family protein [Cyclobacteriaceae bacterium]|nr:DUF5367 family protein [Cyclobacteriaceae bacterium]
MKISRAIISGALIWILVFLLFTLMSFVPVLKDSEFQQNLVLYVFLVPIVMLGASFYYKKGYGTNGFILGLVMAAVGLVLDAVITVPYVIIPHGGSYASFYLNIFLLITAIEFVGITYFYWKLNVR